MEQTINIIYILGKGHSGSTLVHQILGAHSQIASTGELTVFEREFSAPEQKKCSCGSRIADCRYWCEVRRRVEAGGGHWPIDVTSRATFEKNNSTIFDAILEVSGKSWICDCSRDPSRLMQYQSVERFNVFAVHVVRDPRAVAFSMQKKYRHPRSFINALKGARQRYWASRSLLKSPQRHFVLQYERLVADPENEIRLLMKKMGLPFESGQLRFSETPQHVFSGNVMRFRGDTEILHDIGYLDGINRFRWHWSTLTCFRMLKSLNYPLSKKGIRSLSSKQSPGWDR